uniref:40S ribosomal protein S21 n=1 Tax=Pavo cristatus TaxID=9049 RepID=A0A8C9FHZ8_PAVCR
MQNDAGEFVDLYVPRKCCKSRISTSLFSNHNKLCNCSSSLFISSGTVCSGTIQSCLLIFHWPNQRLCFGYAIKVHLFSC